MGKKDRDTQQTHTSATISSFTTGRMSEESELAGKEDKLGALGDFNMHPTRKNLNQLDVQYVGQLEEYWQNSPGKIVDKMKNFTKFVPRSDIARFMTKHEMFKQIIDVHGSIVECGVHMGGGLLSWAQLSSLLEPINHTRHIFGFDSFDGFQDTDHEVRVKNQSAYALELKLDAVCVNFPVPCVPDKLCNS